MKWKVHTGFCLKCLKNKPLSLCLCWQVTWLSAKAKGMIDYLTYFTTAELNRYFRIYILTEESLKRLSHGISTKYTLGHTSCFVTVFNHTLRIKFTFP